MDSVYEDVRSILENRRIRSEILLQQQNEQIRIAHPELADVEKKIADDLVTSVAASDHFSIDKSETVIYGLCADCNKAI